MLCRHDSVLHSSLEPYSLRGSFDDFHFLCESLAGVDVLYHLAARAHVLVPQLDGLEASRYLESNVDISANIFSAASTAGVSRVVFMSSIAVLGDFTRELPFDDNSLPRPSTLYGISKFVAESILVREYASGGMDWVVLRPPLVYGKGAPGNLRLLSGFISKLPFLPFRLLTKRKSYISLKSLVSCLYEVSFGASYSRQTFVISDPGSITFSLIASVFLRCRSLPSYLNLPCPPFLLSCFLSATGKLGLWRKINTELLVDSTRFATLANWTSSVTPVDVLTECFSDDSF